MKKLLHAIDLYCGAGGLSLGLAKAGFKVRAAVDNDAAAVRTYRSNIGDHVLDRSIMDLTAAELLDFAQIAPGECALLAGGPPCQGFSVKRRGDPNDPRNELLLEFFRFIEALRPAFFMVENVKGLLSKHGRPYLDDLMKRASDDGYYCHLCELDAVEYGVPQFRPRAFLVGERTTNEPRFHFPEASLGPDQYKTVAMAIGDLPSPPIDGSCHAQIPNHYRESKLAAINIERIRAVPPGGGRQDLPVHLQLPCHQKNPLLRHVDVYGRLSWDAPSVTITARFDSFTRGRFGHPVEDRSLTLREGARLQTFPDDFVFYGNREECARQIGNAVPPQLAFVLGSAIRDAISKKSRAPKATHQVKLF
jgi:DNA (cytosine-5)-methyltransferase 1